MGQIKTFLSYHSTDKVLAGNIKKQLEKYGLDVFLAHEDIEPTQDWLEHILSEINKTDVLLPLLTDNFARSKWTDQECGIGIAKNAFIIALKVDIDPYGFLSRQQAYRFRRDNVTLSCQNIARLIHKNPKLQRAFLDGMILSFAASESFEEAKSKSSLLIDFNGYNARQVNEAIRSAIDNNQIYSSFGAIKNLHSFLYQYRDKADESLVKTLKKKMS